MSLCLCLSPNEFSGDEVGWEGEEEGWYDDG